MGIRDSQTSIELTLLPFWSLTRASNITLEVLQETFSNVRFSQEVLEVLLMPANLAASFLSQESLEVLIPFFINPSNRGRLSQKSLEVLTPFLINPLARGRLSQESLEVLMPFLVNPLAKGRLSQKSLEVIISFLVNPLNKARLSQKSLEVLAPFLVSPLNKVRLSLLTTEFLVREPSISIRVLGPPVQVI